jgi:predicted Fe-S protein YdhL (DUF1289 family)
MAQLLDPAALNRPPPKPSSGRLLDPGSLGGSTAASADGDGAGGWSPDQARSMASSVAGSLTSLMSAFATSANAASALADKRDDLVRRLDAAIREKAAKLDEYRQGLFCSGCGQTRSEILAKGEEFPHRGQHIIKATPEQIAAKDRELQGIIDRIRKSIEETDLARQKAEKERDEAIDQIRAGIDLWRAALAFERRLIAIGENTAELAYRRKRGTALDKATQINRSGKAATVAAKIQAELDDLSMWAKLLREMDGQRTAQRIASRERLSIADLAAGRERDRISTAANGAIATIKDQIPRNLLQNAVQQIGPGGMRQFGGNAEMQGRRYRMGDRSPERHGEVLANVETFLAAFQATPIGTEMGALVLAHEQLAMVDGWVAVLKDRIRQLASCKPAADGGEQPVAAEGCDAAVRPAGAVSE